MEPHGTIVALRPLLSQCHSRWGHVIRDRDLYLVHLSKWISSLSQFECTNSSQLLILQGIQAMTMILCDIQVHSQKSPGTVDDDAVLDGQLIIGQGAHHPLPQWTAVCPSWRARE